MADDPVIKALNTAKETALHTVDVLDVQLNSLATSIRDHLSHSKWLPDEYRPASRAPPPRQIFAASTQKSGAGLLDVYRSTTSWVSRNKLLASALFAAVTIGTIHHHQSLLQLLPTALQPRFVKRNKRPKRRAARAPSGARTQVVLLSGHPHEPTTGLLALELGKRGFIVYIIVTSASDEAAVLTNLTSAQGDVRPLLVDPTDPSPQLARFADWLNTPQLAAGKTHTLALVGLVIIPALARYPVGPVEALTPDVWSDTVNVNVLQHIVVARSCLRLLALARGRIVVLQSTIVPSLAPPFCALETVVGRATQGWVEAFEREVRPLGVGVALVKVGNVDGVTGSGRGSGDTAGRADILTWPAAIRATYGRAFVSHISSSGSPSTTPPAHAGSSVKPASQKSLFNTVVEALLPPLYTNSPFTPIVRLVYTPRHPFVFRVGSGASIYGFIAGWFPRGLVSWGLGVGRFGSVDVKKLGGPAGLIRATGEDGSSGWENVEPVPSPPQ
ncbi:hypothetical protein DFH27DRAFT_575396 [Peziza echinospora]|nr:hypothetical protein DFH27DRAFT_575396 [Peziza echinospora]